MQSKQEVNDLFVNIINDLINNAMTDAQQATEDIIGVTSKFLDRESQNLVQNFHNLYESEELLELHHMSSDDIDNILNGDFEQVSEATANENSEQIVKINEIQNGVQEVIRKDESVRAEVNIVLNAMQFSEMLRQNLEGVFKTFSVLASNSQDSIAVLREKMEKELHTFDERNAFYQYVLHQEMPKEDEEITQDLIDQIIG